ncbi:HelD family protein [Microterricola viridarii]|uniref:AAA family ATPase n=1 Tax=Microterricola viridarii TaxID=412690 RepID=A0A0Y0N136_9MICO|nr:ATP-binding domain-containing protein [Microterricola viridarii]AMB57627.1 AAA family ATPase [Microterricola viridarii]
MPSSELERERAVVASFYRRLDQLRAEVEGRLVAVQRGNVGSNHQARSERDSFARLHEDNLAQLNEVDARIAFGRLQVAEGGPESGAPDAIHYIGRIGLRDADQSTMLLDWRAPQAGAFYQATAAHPLGVRARRHLTMRERELIRIDDEVLDAALLDELRATDAAAGEALAAASGTLQGEGALLAALTAERTGHMHDIVATIQGEQDRIIRSEMRGALVVQGGPGTGKTAVALHRAAFLIYANRERLKSAGVLVVGPSAAFVHYIEAVLPSLGETGVVMRTLGALFPGVEADTDDAPATAALKGRLEMSGLLARAVRSRQRVPAGPEQIEVNGDTITVAPSLIENAIHRAQRTGKPHNVARVTFVKAAIAELATQLATQLAQAGAAIDDSDIAALREDLRESYAVRVLLNTAWLPLTPEKLLGDLYARPEWLAELTPRWSPERRALLLRERSVPMTVSDVALLDEAAELLGDMPARRSAADKERERQREADIENARAAIANMGVEGMVSAEQLADGFAERGERMSVAERAASDRTWTYGHVVVDEAQELSAMQWRMLVRKSPMRSFTIVGDIAQVSSPAGARSWAEALHAGFGDRWRLEQLSVNYRTPAQIARAAESFAADAGLPITPARAVREGDWPIDTVVADGELAPAVLQAVRSVRADAAGGNLAVIVPAAALDGIADALGAALNDEPAGSRPVVGRGAAGLDLPVAVLTAREAKGLEFDAVVIADPRAIVEESPRGAAALYVAATRPTQRLAMVYPRGEEPLTGFAGAEKVSTFG